MNLDKLRIFHHAGMAKSFTNCGLHLSPSAISRHISDLEYSLKVKLFVRHPKGMSLTPEGERLLETCHSVFRELEDIKSTLSDDAQEPEGVLKVTTPSGWISPILVRMVKPFLADNPGIRLHLKSFDGIPNFSRSEADIALLPFIPDDPNLLGEKIMTFHLGLFASAEYLDKYGVPKTPEDLKGHRLVSYGDHEHPMMHINWLLGLGVPDGQTHEPYLTVNNLYYAGEAGYGIVTLAKENMLLRKNPLVPVLPDLEGPTVDACCVYPKHLEKSKRVQTFLHYIKKETQALSWS